MTKMALLGLSCKNMPKITVLRSCLKFLQFHFLWPKTSEELSPGVVYKVKAITLIAFPYFLPITSVLHIIHVKTNNLDVNLDEDLVCILAVVSLSLVSLEFHLKQGQYAQVLLKLCDYKYGRPKNLDRIETLLSWLSKAFYFFASIGVVLYGLVPSIEQPRCEEYYKAKGIDELCGYFIPTPPSLIPKIDSIFLKPMIIVIQVFGAYTAILPAGMNCILVFEINVHLVVHMRNLKSQFKSLSPSRDLKKELYNLVKYHQHIIEIMDSINSCCSRALCIHTFLTSSVIGGILKQILNLTWETPVGPVIHLTGWVIALSVNSLGGEIILNESTTIGSGLYLSDWMEFDQSIKKDVWFIISRTQQPLLLITGPFGYMSLGVFIAVIKGIYTLTILPGF